jgi:prevent-host-death family protein
MPRTAPRAPAAGPAGVEIPAETRRIGNRRSAVAIKVRGSAPECARLCENVQNAFVQATLTELRRDTSRVVRAADNGEEVILTEHGEPRYKLQRVQDIDRKAAAAALRAIGPVDFLPRK